VLLPLYMTRKLSSTSFGVNKKVFQPFFFPPKTYLINLNKPLIGKEIEKSLKLKIIISKTPFTFYCKMRSQNHRNGSNGTKDQVLLAYKAVISDFMPVCRHIK